MKRLVAAVGVFTISWACAASDVTSDREEECATTRDVQNVIVNLRDRGWSAQRIADSVLEVSRVRDVETRGWFLNLVSNAFERGTTIADVSAEYQRCVAPPPVTTPLRM